MGVKIKPAQADNLFFVNGKGVHKDMNGNWIASPELTQNEKREFINYIGALEDGKTPAPEVSIDRRL